MHRTRSCPEIARISAAVTLTLCAIGCGSAVAEGVPLAVTHSPNTLTCPLYDVFELTFRHENDYANPFFDVTLDVTFASPSGKQVTVGGFHYGSSQPAIITPPQGEGKNRRKAQYRFESQDVWKARFAPNEAGLWEYRYVFTCSRGGRATGDGAFHCVTGRKPNPGFVRQNPSNPFTWVFDDGSPYFPIGLQECLGDGYGLGSALAGMSMEGPFRMDREGRPALPPGAMFVPGPSNNPINGDVYFRRYARAGFNLFRYSQRNCSYELTRDFDNYLVQEALMTDELLRHVRKYGFRVMYGIFGFGKAFNDEPANAEAMAKVKRFIKYSVDRWGAYTDFWEFLNEQKASEGWYEIMIPYLQSIDPYHHPITTSWERPDLDGIEISAPHWYQREDEHQSDAITANRAKNWKKHGKPVIVGEQGNHIDRKKENPPGVGGVWDARSALRMRIRNWTALFNEISVVFWATSYAKDGHFMNLWIGPYERQYVKAMQDFAYCLDRDVKMLPVKVSDPSQARAYALASATRAGVYLHHFGDHESSATGLKLTLTIPAKATAYWYSPEDGAFLGEFEVQPGQQTLDVPAFVVDLALLVTPDAPPDADGDGQPNGVDADDDNDGVTDDKDAFPLESEEWEDKDGDMIGDVIDADDDADGKGDDQNGNGTPDCDELDLDGDGYAKSKAVPWDAFPWDPREWQDTDGDGIGDNVDIDDDGDGWSDEEEAKAGTSPVDRLSFPAGK